MKRDAINKINPAYLAVAVITAALVALGFSLNYPSAVKGNFFSDCATYYGLTSSLAEDFDIEYKPDDIVRIYKDFDGGPSGIFLQQNRETGKLYYGKSYIYPLVLAPAFKLFGHHGILITHALLLGLMLMAATLFLERRWGSSKALLMALAFILPTAAFVFFFWIAPEFFNMSLVFLGYFFLLYKYTNPLEENEKPGVLRGFLLSFWTDYLAIILLGLVAFSKISNIVLAVPIFLILLSKKKWLPFFAGGVLIVLVVVSLFGIRLLVAGEWNFQGGVRKSFHGEFPLANGKTFETASQVSVETNLGKWEFPFFLEDIAHNFVYYFAGRFGGIIPYFFPAFLALLLFFIFPGKSLNKWFLLLGIIMGAGIYIILIPTNVIGGGGTVANRYFMNIFPMFFFLLPEKKNDWADKAAFLGGFIFMGHILINPIYYSRFPAHYADSAILRLLPVEFTMLNDLPINTDSSRRRMPWFKTENGQPARFKDGPNKDDLVYDFYLYQLDYNSFTKEPNPFSFYQNEKGETTRDLLTKNGKQQLWTKGSSRAEMIMRTGEIRNKLKMTVTNSAVDNNVVIKVHNQTTSITMKPGEKKTFEFALGDTFAYHYLSTSYLYSLVVSCDNGISPRTMAEGANDFRYLGVMLELETQ